MDHTYTLMDDENSVPEKEIQTLNLDAESVWYQMNADRPTFFKAWQSVTLASTTMLEAEMLNTFYAYQAQQYFFYNVQDVKTYVLPYFEESQ